MSFPPWLQKIYHLAQRWWSSDRVRISPRERALWQLPAGCVLTIQGVDMELIECRPSAELPAALELLCSSQQGCGVLQVLSSEKKPYHQLFWCAGENRTELHVADVQVWN